MEDFSLLLSRLMTKKLNKSQLIHVPATHLTIGSMSDYWF